MVYIGVCIIYDMLFHIGIHLGNRWMDIVMEWIGDIVLYLDGKAYWPCVYFGRGVSIGLRCSRYE